jgi:predicted ABC-type ATPase
LRIFAGPNGSGKSTVIRSISETTINNRKLDFGVYINADDIAVALRKNVFTFLAYGVRCFAEDILEFASTSGLLTDFFNQDRLRGSFTLIGDKVILKKEQCVERVSQIIARFLRERLLAEKRRFSFETVFSHESNLDIMRRAAEQGYKVYLYFVSTESPKINKYRVAFRVKENGHDVPAGKIESRYYRSLKLARSASDIAYQAFFFDNSIDNEPFRLTGHFRRVGDEKIWDIIDESQVSNWFKKYCI